MNNNLIGLYLLSINLLSGLVFSIDKNAAKKGRRRIPERTLHLLEILGGVFANIFLMFTIRHKNRKFSYWGWTMLVLIGWVIMLIYWDF